MWGLVIMLLPASLLLVAILLIPLWERNWATLGATLGAMLGGFILYPLLSLARERGWVEFTSLLFDFARSTAGNAQARAPLALRSLPSMPVVPLSFVAAVFMLTACAWLLMPCCGSETEPCLAGSPVLPPLPHPPLKISPLQRIPDRARPLAITRVCLPSAVALLPPQSYTIHASGHREDDDAFGPSYVDVVHDGTTGVRTTSSMDLGYGGGQGSGSVSGSVSGASPRSPLLSHGGGGGWRRSGSAGLRGASRSRLGPAAAAASSTTGQSGQPPGGGRGGLGGDIVSHCVRLSSEWLPGTPRTDSETDPIAAAAAAFTAAAAQQAPAADADGGSAATASARRPGSVG